jgi:long-subunit fatty acid transport protein
MIRYLLATAAVLSAGAAHAGTISRSEQPVIILFEKGGETGRYVEGAISWGKPDVTGVDSDGNSTGQVGKENWLLGGGFKMDFNEKWSAALIYDQPFGADLEYQDSSLLYGGTGGTNADVDALALTALARYKFNQNFSVHGGLRFARFGADASLDGTAFGPLQGYDFTGDEAWGVGGVVGVAYERPELALRVILTYSSEITYDLDSTEDFPPPLAGFSGNSTTEVVSPQSVNLDFQTGVAKGTLVFGQIRWVNWDGFEVRPKGLDAVTGQPLAFKDYNVTHFKLGIGRQFTPTWAGAFQVNYTPDEDNLGGVLDVVDGNKGVVASGTYTAPNGVKVTGAAQYTWFGDSTIQSGRDANGDPAGAEFTDNSGLALLLRVAYNF